MLERHGSCDQYLPGGAQKCWRREGQIPTGDYQTTQFSGKVQTKYFFHCAHIMPVPPLRAALHVPVRHRGSATNVGAHALVYYSFAMNPTMSESRLARAWERRLFLVATKM